MSKTIIAPIVSTLALGASIIFHKSIPTDVQNQLTETVFAVITVGTTLYGIFKNHKTEKEATK